MHRFFGEQDAYSLFNSMSYYLLLFESLFLFKYKKDALGLFSKIAIRFIPSKVNLDKIALFLFASVEALLMARAISRSTFLNMTFGELVGTGGNYFATLILMPIILFALSLVLIANPIKQIDIYTLLLPLYLIPVKLACFFNGCCWGIPWEYGLYNYHYDHPGRQVPVQAIEAFFALAIFIFLLIYKKKAKTGTLYPMYIILYSFTRFFSEFLKADYPNVLGPLKVYHILCIIGFIVGLILFFLMRKFGEKISDFFEKPQEKINNRINKSKELKEQKIAEEKAKAEADMLERLEKSKRAREKAKGRKK